MKFFFTMTFEETTQFLYNQLPVFQKDGASAYKPGLQNTEALDVTFKHPHKAYKTIHVGGTNGKGSTSHTLAAILQKAGYKVGLYTSPHLVDFRERIRIDGQMIPKQYVIDFVADNFNKVAHIQPSFFELTMMMAFCYFREQKVDIAIIEVGLGGRLDSTNIITPQLSIITNISFDHIQLLGNTLAQIATEKAGIIKSEIPTVIGEASNDTIKKIFADKGKECNAKIVFAEDTEYLKLAQKASNGNWIYKTAAYDDLEGILGGDCQIKNTRTILAALPLLKEAGFEIPDHAVREGFAEVVSLTGLQGRWQKINDMPLTYCDTGHNEGGISYIVDQLKRQQCTNLRIIIGMVNDKDIHHIIKMLPTYAIYYFTQASVNRALPVGELKKLANTAGLQGSAYISVAEAYDAALSDSSPEDFIFIGGSNFIVGDLLNHLHL